MIDPCNGLETPGIDLHVHSKLIFDKDAKLINWGKDILSNKRSKNNWISVWKKMKFDPHFSACEEIKSKLVIN